MKESLTAKQRLLSYELSGVTEVISATPLNRFEKKMMEAVAKVQEVTVVAATANVHAPESLSGISTLEELRRTVENFNGCSLKKTATNTVFAVGAADSDIMFIGEAPGADEDKQGKPFVGASGKLLDLMLQSIGLSRETNCYITNILPWRPPGNRTPNQSEINLCMPFVRKHIELFNPKIIVLLGACPLNALMESNYAITKIRGHWFNYGGIPVLPTYHPAYLLRSPMQKKYSWQDLLALRDKAQALGISL